MKTIQMTIDEPLLKAVDKACRARKATRSAFSRDALAQTLNRQSVEEQESRHAQGYKSKPIKAGEFDVWAGEQDWGAA